MGRLGRPGLSDVQKQELWRRWQSGESLSDIGRVLGKHAASIHGVVARRGGFVPTVRTRAARTLTLSERESISRGLAAGVSIRALARQLARAPSTLSREIARHDGRAAYRATHADAQAWDSALRPKPCRLATSPRLRTLVAEKLQLNWSPAQIAGWLRRQHPGNAAMQISHETIYRSLFIQARGVLKKELVAHLRTRRMMRKSRLANTEGQPRGQITDAISIRDRPAEIEDRAVPGHWEGDLLSGSKNSHIATLVERTSRFTLLVKVKGKHTTSVVSAIARQIQTLPVALRRSLTWDRGMELARHKQLALATAMQVYFCDPQSPWQRGTNENTNGLLRQYFPRGTDLAGYTQAALNRTALQLNQRPRKTLGYRTPAEAFIAAVALTD